MNKQKRYFHIDSGISMGNIFTLLDTAQNDNEDEIDESMNDSETKFKVPEEIKVNDNPDNARVLTTEADIYIFDKGTTHTKELGTNKKKKKVKRNVSAHFRQNCLPVGRVPYKFEGSASAFNI